MEDTVTVWKLGVVGCALAMKALATPINAMPNKTARTGRRNFICGLLFLARDEGTVGAKPAFVYVHQSLHLCQDSRHRRRGPITKAGNGHARRALVEGAWAYQYNAKVSPAIQKRLQGLPQTVQDIAWKAQVRFCKRFRRLLARGKHPNVVVTAIARELAAFMWAIAKEVLLTA
jgi:hypothetical protein